MQAAGLQTGGKSTSQAASCAAQGKCKQHTHIEQPNSLPDRLPHAGRWACHLCDSCSSLNLRCYARSKLITCYCNMSLVRQTAGLQEGGAVAHLILPMAVAGPVPVTMARARPAVITVPCKHPTTAVISSIE